MIPWYSKLNLSPNELIFARHSFANQPPGFLVWALSHLNYESSKSFLTPYSLFLLIVNHQSPKFTPV